MERNLEQVRKIVKDDGIERWSVREEEEINKVEVREGVDILLQDMYRGIIWDWERNKGRKEEGIYE